MHEFVFRIVLTATRHKNTQMTGMLAINVSIPNLTVARSCAVFSKRQRITLRLLYAIGRPSVVCLSVVCDVGAPYSGG